MELNRMYETLGISREVYDYGERVLKSLGGVQSGEGAACHAEKPRGCQLLRADHGLRLQ